MMLRIKGQMLNSSFPEQVISELRGITGHMGFNCHLMSISELVPTIASQTGCYSICLPRRDGRL